MALFLKIISPKGIFFNDEVKIVTVKTTEGYIGILEFHSPIVANIQISKMTFRDKNNQEIALLISGGLLITTLHECRIITDKVEYVTTAQQNAQMNEDLRKKRINES